ncbi:MAG: hypothetical protein Q9187_004379 [Circinaria calcarea]
MAILISLVLPTTAAWAQWWDSGRVKEESKECRKEQMRHSSNLWAFLRQFGRAANRPSGLEGDEEGGIILCSHVANLPTQIPPSTEEAHCATWAWQNTHLTRRIADEQRITIRETITKRSPKTGRTRRRPARPRMSLVDKLSNLHLLLRIPSFARWPLNVRFFCEDVHQAWQKWSNGWDGEIRSGIKIAFDPRQPPSLNPDLILAENTLTQSKRNNDNQGDAGKGGVEGIDSSYAPLKSHLEKSLFLLAESETTQCSVCTGTIQPMATTVVCPDDACRTASHVTCLSKKFLAEEEQGELLIPTEGHCPGCDSHVQWVDLVKELSLRLRGEKEVTKLMRKPRQRKTTATGTKRLSSEIIDEFSDDVGHEDLDRVTIEEEVDASCLADIVDEPLLEEAWNYDEEDDDVMSVTSVDSRASLISQLGNPNKIKASAPRMEIVIEDSDWDDAEVLD